MKPDVEHVIIRALKMRISSILFILLWTFQSYGQGNIPIGTWRTHFNFEKALSLEKANEKIYCLTEQGLFYYDTQENSTTKLSKADGLSDVNITAVAFDDQSDLLSIGYANGNIDLVMPNEVFNVATVKNSFIVKDKNINHIAHFNGKVYFSTNFGVIVLDPETGDIEEAYENLGETGISLGIEQALFVNDHIYLATSEGVLQGNVSDDSNLRDFSNWERFQGSPVKSTAINSLAVANSNVYASSSSTVYIFNGVNWTDIGFNTSGESIVKIKSNDSGLLVITDSSIQVLASDGSITSLTLEVGDQPMDILIENSGIFWYADFGKGLSKNENGSIERIVPNGIFTENTARLEFVNNSIFAFPRFAQNGSTPQTNNLGYSNFNNGIWSNILPDEILDIDDISDAVALSEDILVLSSFGHGVLDLTAGVLYDETNSPLINNDPSGKEVLISTMDIDQNGNVWVGQIGLNSLLKFAPDKTWEAFSLGNIVARNPQDIQIDALGQIWMLPQPGFTGAIGYNPETGITRHFTDKNSSLPDADVTDLAIDRSGQIWMGTESGLVFLPFSFGAIDDNSVDFIEPIFGNRVLFSSEKINAIEADAANRKWIATADGLWLFEDDGDEIIHNFNTENSPLPSNTIIDLKTNSATGEVFIATDKGLVSFRSDAVEGNSFHQNVKIFPNPVPPGFLGLVGINGLAEDVTLKITDVSGKLVREINAAGGGASWDVADYNGVRAQTGIYLVFSSDDDGSETFVGKIAIIN